MRPRLILVTVLLAFMGSCQACPEACDPEFGLAPDECSLPIRVKLQLVTAADMGEAPVGLPLSPRPRVRVVFDGASDQPVSGARVDFSILEGEGRLSPEGAATVTRLTDGNGYVEAPWILGPSPGRNRLRIAVRLDDPADCDVLDPTCPVVIGQAFDSPREVAVTATARVPGAIAIVEGDGQSAAAGTATAVAPAVLLSDASGPLAGVAVVFSVQQGGGSVAQAETVTDGAGVARVGSWTLGPAAGTNNNVLRADAGAGLQRQFTATATAGPARFLVVAAGQNQSGAPGAALPAMPLVRVADQFDNSIAGVDVLFEVGASGGTVGGASSATVATDGEGLAAAGTWVLGGAPGTYTVTATVAETGINGNPALFSATAVPVVGPPTTMEIAAAPPPSPLPVAQPVPVLPAVIVTDDEGRPVPGVRIEFSAGNASGTVTGGSQVTGPDGIATLTSWTLGTIAGTQYVIAEAPDHPAVQPGNLAISVTAVAGPPRNMVVVQGNNQVAIAGQATPLRPAVRITDQYGNGVRSLRVRYTITGGGGAISEGSGQVSTVERFTAENGIGSIGAWILGEVPGANTLQVEVPSPEGDGMITRLIVFTAQGTPNPGISCCSKPGVDP